MARSARIDFPGAMHHVYARGIEKRRIFQDDKDRLVFLERVGCNIDRWKVRCFSWALMENHFHLLIQTDKGSLPSFMRCLLTAFSMYFNERHERVGHLFQNRYMSKLISKESYLREAIRYVHLNPIRAGLIHSLDELDVYRWTGHRQIMKGGGADWMDFAVMRELFHAPGVQWETSYHDFIKAGYDIFRSGSEGNENINENFLRKVDLSKYTSPSNRKPPREFFNILVRVSVQTGVPADQIMGGGRKHFEVDARRAVLTACMECLNVPAARISRWLGISEACGYYLLRTK